MRLLLDTHVFMWWVSSSEQLPQQVLDLLEDSENPLFLSVASIWEIQIKSQNGKLELGKPLAQLISNQQANNGLAILLIEPAHVYALQGLPDVHRDPFDRIMIAQAIVEDLAFVISPPAYALRAAYARWGLWGPRGDVGGESLICYQVARHSPLPIPHSRPERVRIM